MKNDFVNICALKNCIKQGARCLDFEVYSCTTMPAIAFAGNFLHKLMLTNFILNLGNFYFQL